MDGLREWTTTIFLVLVFGVGVLAGKSATSVSFPTYLSYSFLSDQDRVYMVSTPEPVAMPLYDETTLICELNLKPDNFTWRHYPIQDPRVPINLSKSPFRELPREQHKEERKRSELRISVCDLGFHSVLNS